MESPIITFIIPTLGRFSLLHTIQSLQKQKVNAWKCIILFDGIKNTHFQHFQKDPRITILEIAKTGENQLSSRAGLVRNIAFDHVDTTWIGFVDDDDTLSPYYINHLMEDMQENDIILFRMIYKNRVFLPPSDISTLKRGEVGISFCLKSHLIKNDPDLRFQNDAFEDFLFLQKLLEKKYSIFVSSHVTYYIKSQYFHFENNLSSTNIQKKDSNSDQISIQQNQIFRKRLFISLKGGLGNILFQIFTGLHFGQMENRDIFFIYGTDHFRKDVIEYKIFESLLPSLLHLSQWKMIPKHSLVTFQETNPFENQDLFQFMHEYRDSEMILLQGYFQHISLFHSTFYTFKSNFFSPILSISFTSKRIISIHIRATDYIKYSDIYFILPNSYYENALESIQLDREKDEIILFTDDVNYVKENMNFIKKYPILFSEDLVHPTHYQKDEVEMMWMSQSDVIISANSTFSLWAGYLSKKNSKIIIPDQYFSHQNAYIPMSHFLHPDKDYQTINT
jgi:hypothetical protein